MATEYRIKPVSAETEAAIKRKSAFNLPDRPSERGMKPDEIKRTLYGPITDDENSVLAELRRIVKEANVILADVDIPLIEVTLTASAWVGEASPYSQVVKIEIASERSKIDLQPSAEQLATLRNINLAFVIENHNGVITAYAIGDKPECDYTFQGTITEVLTNNEIIMGNTIGTNSVRPNFLQTDERASDYIENNPIPAVTSEDEGKILRVKDGEWSAVEIAYAEDGDY